MPYTQKTVGKIAGIVLVCTAIFLGGFALIHHLQLGSEEKKIVPNGKMVEIDGVKMHVYISQSSQENSITPTLVFLAGSGTATPVYNFKPLYSLLTKPYKIIVVEKFLTD
jgi:hypothetical protein